MRPSRLVFEYQNASFGLEAVGSRVTRFGAGDEVYGVSTRAAR